MSTDDLPDDYPDFLDETRNARFTRPPSLAYKVHQIYPHIDSESELYRNALRDIVRQHENGTTPEGIFREFSALIRSAGGALPVALVEHDGGERIRVDPGQGDVLELGLDAEEHMEIEVMERSELQKMEREELVQRVVELQKELSE